jgi:hypothetical protein
MLSSSRFDKATLYGVASIACPVLFVACGAIYNHLSNRAFWSELTPGDTNNAAGAMMAFAEVGNLTISFLVGSGFGLLLGIRSAQARGGMAGAGTFGIVLNALPLAALALGWFCSLLMS